MSFYKVHARYLRPSGTETSAFITVEAGTQAAAITKAKRRLDKDPVRRIASWGECTAVKEGATAPAPRSDFVRAGDTVTVAIPFTGVVQHVDAERVEIVAQNPNYPQGVARRRMTREFFTQLTGRVIEPRPPVVTVEYHSIYPNGAHYQSDRPVKYSDYGVENLVQVRVTKHDGAIVLKEIV